MRRFAGWVKFAMQFANFFAMLLVCGGLLCFIAYAIDSSDSTNLYLGVVLVTVVLVTATFSYFQEAKSEKIMEGFKNMIPKKCKVIRDGTTQIVDAVELVPGDVVDLNDGDQVPFVGLNQLFVQSEYFLLESQLHTWFSWGFPGACGHQDCGCDRHEG